MHSCSDLQISARNCELVFLFLNQKYVVCTQKTVISIFFETSKHKIMFKLKGKKKATILRSNILLNWDYVSFHNVSECHWYTAGHVLTNHSRKVQHFGLITEL